MSVLLRTRRARTSPIGLDIGHTAIRAVQLRRVAGKYELLRAARLDLPRDDAPEFELTERAQRVRLMLRSHGFRGRSAIVGVGPPDAELHVLELPEQAIAGSPAQVAQATRVELERLMGYDPGTVETAHWCLPRTGRGKNSAIGVAAPRASVTSLWGLCRGAGLLCRRVDAEACAWARFGSAIQRRSADSAAPENEPQHRGTADVWGILDIGHRSARLVLCVHAVPVLTRSLDAGGERWTRLIAEGLEISVNSAEVHKCDHGLSGFDETARTPGDAAVFSARGVAGMIHNILRRELESMASQIERSYAYVLQCHPQASAGGLILAGGGAGLKNLDSFLSRRLGVTVTRPEVGADSDGALVDARTGPASRLPLSDLACAVGLALDP